jgi:hypothetical protein
MVDVAATPARTVTVVGLAATVKLDFGTKTVKPTITE